MNNAIWPLDQTVFLVKHYATMSIQELVEGLAEIGDARSVHAIFAKARALELAKREHRGHFTKRRAAQLARDRVRHAPLREQIIAILARDEEGTIRYFADQTGSTLSGCWKVCERLINQANAHVVRWEVAHGGYAAVIRIGRGRNAPKPNPTQQKIAAEIPQPIPRPELGAWGCSW